MKKTDKLGDDFKKSSLSGVTKNLCVEVAIRKKEIAVRDSKAPGAGTLSFTPDEWDAFVKGVKAGEFDIG